MYIYICIYIYIYRDRPGFCSSAPSGGTKKMCPKVKKLYLVKLGLLKMKLFLANQLQTI